VNPPPDLTLNPTVWLTCVIAFWITAFISGAVAEMANFSQQHPGIGCRLCSKLLEDDAHHVPSFSRCACLRRFPAGDRVGKCWCVPNKYADLCDPFELNISFSWSTRWWSCLRSRRARMVHNMLHRCWFVRAFYGICTLLHGEDNVARAISSTLKTSYIICSLSIYNP
jgi:hypothetical protein